MSDEHTAEPKATIGLVYKLVNDLTASVDAKLDNMDQAMRQQFAELRNLVESLRDEIPTRRECQYRHEEVDASILAAVNASKDDRQNIWNAIHAVESQLKWAAGIIIAAFLGVIVYLLQGHLIG